MQAARSALAANGKRYSMHAHLTMGRQRQRYLLTVKEI